jgi:hypothetical protein
MERQRRDSVIEWINTGGESVNPTDSVEQSKQIGEFKNEMFMMVTIIILLLRVTRNIN